jgi:CDP-glycerol glycerophosphotransferase (TagB/SpsB family)
MQYGYFIADSLHYLPIVEPLIRTTGGVLITLAREVKLRFDGAGGREVNTVHYKNSRRLVEEFPGLGVEVLVHPSFSIHRFRKFHGLKHVQVFHGVSDKPFDYHESLREYDLIAVPGPLRKERIVQKGLAAAEKIVEIGFPKIDAFLHSSFDAVSFKKTLGFDNDKKTVLYAPTWSDPKGFSSFARSATAVMRGLSQYNVIVKPHINTLRYRPWQILKAVIAKRKNCVIKARSSNVLPFMALSDLMITDISSVSQEYLAFDRPLVFIDPKPRGHIPPENTWMWRCGEVVRDVRGIARAVSENLEYTDKFANTRAEAKNRIFLPFDGKSADRFKNALVRAFG